MDTFNKPPCPCAVERDFWAPTKERERGDFLSLEKKGPTPCCLPQSQPFPFLYRPLFPIPADFLPAPTGLVWCVGRALLLSLSCGVKWLLLPPSGPGDIPYLAHLFRLTPSDDCPTRNRKKIYIKYKRFVVDIYIY